MNHKSLRLGIAISLSAILCGLSFDIDVLAKKKPKRRRAARTTASLRQRTVTPAVTAMPRLATRIQSTAPVPNSNGVAPTPTLATTIKSPVTTTPTTTATTTPKSTVKAPTLSGPNPSAAAGDLDTSFSGDGKQNKDIGGNSNQALAVAIQADGKIVVAGWAVTNVVDFAVARFNTDGSLDDGTGTDSTPGDGAFATAGVFTADFAAGDDRAQAIAIQSDGAIVLAGFATQAGTKNFALLRLTSAGALDSSFDLDGKLITNVSAGANDEARGVAIQSDGRIIAAGLAEVGGGQDFALVRYNTNGSLDDNSGSDSTPGDSYGTAGKAVTNLFSANDLLNGIVLQPDGKAVAAGQTFGPSGSFNFVLARYTTAGVLDTTFAATDGDGLNGATATDFGSSDDSGKAVALQSDGKIVVAGHAAVVSMSGSSRAFALSRYNTDGSLDDGSGTDITPLDAFDSDGKRIDDFLPGQEDAATAVAIQTDGRIVAGGYSNMQSGGFDSFKDFRIATYTSTGSLDTGFGTGGSVTTDFNGGQDELYGLALQTDKKIVAAGFVNVGGQDIGLARYDGGTVATPATPGELIISEFRLRGPNGAEDEFIEIYNNTASGHTVAAASGSGYGIAASDGVTRCSIPNNTFIPSGGHFLCVNSTGGTGYSLTNYPAGEATFASGNSAYLTDIPDNAGIALFNNDTGGASYSLANRLDAVGSTSEANAIYREGAGLIPVSTGTLQYAWVRDTCGKSGSVTTMGLCTRSTPKDTNDNASDFFFIDTAGTPTAAGQRLGAPGPENLASPIQRNSAFVAAILDPCVSDTVSPNRVRNTTPDPGNNSTFGTLEIRRTITNNTGADITRLRWRVIDISTLLAPGSTADLRVRSSSDVAGVIVDRAPCGSGTSSITVRGTTLETPPNQSAGGGFNSSLLSGTVTFATPLANGASIDVRFLLGVQKTGLFKIYLNIEALP